MGVVRKNFEKMSWIYLERKFSDIFKASFDRRESDHYPIKCTVI